MSKPGKSTNNTTTDLLMPLATPPNLTELQAAYGVSCSLYEHKADKKLQQSDTIIVSGFGCSLRVKNSALEIFPGKTHAAQTQGTVMLYRGVHSVTSIIILSDTGVISLDAVKYCNEQGITIIMIDGKGNLVQSLTPESLSNAALRRKQYLAHENGKAGYVANALVCCKIKGQLDILERHSELPGKRAETIEAIKTGLQWFDLSPLPSYLTNINYLRTYEGRIAAMYFECWRGLKINWGKTDRKTVPPHWTQVTERSSPLSHNHGAWKAVDPCNAVLNYAYAILEGQTRRALNSVGFDCAAGFLHSDLLYRDSLVFDAMEILRPKVDDLVLQLLSTVIYHKGDLKALANGQVHFNPQFARYIAASCQLPQKEVDESAMWFKSLLMKD